MQTIGIIGGMSWYSTINYYRIINAQVQEALGGHHSARVLIDSLDFDAVRACQLAEDWDTAGAMLAASGRRLQDAGADTVLIGTNLMHKVAPAVEAALDVPLLHIADAVGAAAQRRGFDRLAIVGTKWVMGGDVLRRPPGPVRDQHGCAREGTPRRLGRDHLRRTHPGASSPTPVGRSSSPRSRSSQPREPKPWCSPAPRSNC